MHAFINTYINIFHSHLYFVLSSFVAAIRASTGIGRHAAEHLASIGYTVFAGVRKVSNYNCLI